MIAERLFRSFRIEQSGVFSIHPRAKAPDEAA